MLNDRQKLALSHALAGFLAGSGVILSGAWSLNLLVLLLSLVLTGHAAQRLLGVRSYRIGGFVGWLLSGAMVYVLWYLYAELLIFNLLH